jgi:hypothetical protein
MTLGSTQPLNRNEYQEYFLVDKGGRYIWLNLPPYVPIFLKFWSLNLLEPSGPVMGLLYLSLAKIYSFHVSITRAKLTFESFLHDSCSINSINKMSAATTSYRLPHYKDSFRPVFLSGSSPAYFRTARC